MSVNPKNPTIPHGQETPQLGQTRATNNGRLEWYDSSTQTWRSAFRQTAIRHRLLRRAKEQEGTYVYSRGKGSGDNETAPLREDLNYGPNWANRPALLFQLEPTEDQRCVEPTGVLMFNDHVMLDPFDHPIRDFGRDLPIVLSTELKGDEVEHYLRKNLAIKVYDLIARMLNGYTIRDKTRPGPPRIMSVRERATKFREKAGCIAWTKRTGSQPLNDYIFSLLPAGATTTLSLGRDLTTQQMADRKAENKGKFGNRRRKAKRELEDLPKKEQEALQKREQEYIEIVDSSDSMDESEDGFPKRDHQNQTATTVSRREQGGRNSPLSFGSNTQGLATFGGPHGGHDRSLQPRRRKRSIDESSSDDDTGLVDANIKRRKFSLRRVVAPVGADRAINPSQRAFPRLGTPASSSNLNQIVFGGASGRAKQATETARSRRRKVHIDLTEQESDSEYEESSSTSSTHVDSDSSPDPDTDVQDDDLIDLTRNDDRSERDDSHVPDFSPEMEECLPVEFLGGLNPNDARLRIPSNSPDMYKLRRALQLSVADFAVRSGHGAVNVDEAYDLTEHEHESYICQYYRMQLIFNSVCDERGLGRGPPLYSLDEWTGGLGSWEFAEDDDHGPWLQQLLQENAPGYAEVLYHHRQHYRYTGV